MRFSILHGLLLMVLIALSMVYLQAYLATKQARERVQQKKDQMQLLREEQSDTYGNSARLSAEQPLFDAWNQLDESLEQGILQLQMKYGQIQPVENRVVIREVPSLQPEDGVVKTWRVLVPVDRQASVCLGTDNVEISYRVQDHDWSGGSNLRPAGPFAFSLTGGEHLLELRNKNEFRDWSLTVDGHLLWASQCELTFDGRSSQGISTAARQAELNLEERPTVLHRVNYEAPNSLDDVNLILWLDAPNTTLPEFPEVSSAEFTEEAE